jgi:hypothetical protein
MQDMNETSIRDLLQQAMTDDEPPLGPHIVSGAVRAARKVRRLRLAAGIGAAAAIVPALAFGVPAVAGALAPTAPAQQHAALAPGPSGPAHASTAPAPKQPHSRSIVPPNAYSLFRPVLPAVPPVADPVPITDQSVGQLLIDDMPAGARLSQIMARADANAGDPSAVGQLAEGQFNDVTTAFGSGLVTADLLHDATEYFGSTLARRHRTGHGTGAF